MLLCWKVLKLNEDVSIRSVEKRKKLPTKQFSWFFFSLSPHWLPDMLEISGSKDLRYLSIRSSIYRCWADHEDYKKLQLYLRWYIFVITNIYPMSIFSLLYEVFMGFSSFIFCCWIYYEFRKRILNQCLCVYNMHIIWPFYDTIDSCCMQFTKTRKIMCLLRHCACLIICIWLYSSILVF